MFGLFLRASICVRFFIFKKNKIRDTYRGVAVYYFGRTSNISAMEDGDVMNGARTSKKKHNGSDGMPKLNITSGNISPDGGMILKTFNILPVFVRSEDIQAIVESRLSKPFEQMTVNDLSEIQLPEITINLDEEIGKSYLNTGELGLYLNYLKTKKMLSSSNVSYDHFSAKSKIQPNVTVTGTVLPGQKSAVKLNPETLQTTSEIFRNIPAVQTGFEDFVKSTFEQPFYITLRKNDFNKKAFDTSNPRSNVKTPKKKNISGDVKGSTTNDGDEEKPDAYEEAKAKYDTIQSEFGKDEIDSLMDLPDQILMDKITSEAQNKFFGPFLTGVEALRLQISVVPFYFRSETTQIPLYFKKDGSYSREKPIRVDSNEPNEKLTVNSKTNQSKTKQQQQRRQGQKPVGVIEYLQKQLSHDVRKITDELFTNLKLDDGNYFLKQHIPELRYIGLNQYVDVMNHLDVAEYAKINTYDDESGETEEGSNSENIKKYGSTLKVKNIYYSDYRSEEFKNGLSVFISEMNSERLSFIDRINELMTELSRNWASSDSDDKINDNNAKISEKIKKMDDEIEKYSSKWTTVINNFAIKHGYDSPIDVPKIVIPDILRGVMVNVDPIDRDDDEAIVYSVLTPDMRVIKKKKVKKIEKNDDELDYRYLSQIQDDDGYDENHIDLNKDSEDSDVELRYIHVTHNVPTIPDMNHGQIYRYFDGSVVKYLWTWNESSGTSTFRNFNDVMRNIEPFMLFIVFNNVDDAGLPQSPLTTLIPTYLEYRDLKERIKIQSKTGNVDTFVIESTLSKPEKIDSDYLSGKQFMPVFQTGDHVKLPDIVGEKRSSNSNMSSLFLSTTDASQSLRMTNGSKMNATGDQSGIDANVQHTNRLAYYDKYMQKEPFQMLSKKKSITSARPSAYELYLQQTDKQTVEQYSLINEKHVTMGNLTAAAIGRPVIYTPLGFCVELRPGESLKKIESKLEIDYERLERLEDRLTEEGGILTGYPITNLVSTNNASSSKAAYSAYGTKNEPQTVNSINVGYRLHQENKNPTQERRVSHKEQMLETYSKIVAEIFSLAYQNFINVEQTWYERLVKKTFDLTGNKYHSLPPPISLFDVNVTFPPSSNASMNEILSLYNMNAVKPRDVALCLAAITKKSMGTAPYDFMKIYAGRESEDFLSFEDGIKTRLDELRNLELDKQRPQKTPQEQKKTVAKKSKTETSKAQKKTDKEPKASDKKSQIAPKSESKKRKRSEELAKKSQEETPAKKSKKSKIMNDDANK